MCIRDSYLLIAAGLLFVLLLLGTLRKAARGRARPGRTAVAVLGCLVAAFGFHLFAGGLIGQFVGGFGFPVAQVCSGPQCAVGVGSGVIGIPVGVLALIVGLMLRARRGAPPPVTSGQGPVYWAGGGSLN